MVSVVPHKSCLPQCIPPKKIPLHLIKTPKLPLEKSHLIKVLKESNLIKLQLLTIDYFIEVFAF